MVPLQEGPPLKLQKLNSGGGKRAQSSQSSHINSDCDSSFSFKNHIPSSSSDDFILDITKFIPVGCWRIRRSDIGITLADWNSCKGWAAFPHPRDITHHCGGPYIGKELQTLFFECPFLKQYLPLHYAGWIRLEFKTNDSNNGQIRVYILPDDVGRASIDRNSQTQRKLMQTLLTTLDISLITWNGAWSESSPYFHVDPSLDKDSKDEPSLFHIFNNLPSPKPNPELIADPYVRDAMLRLLSSDVPGLKTTMHNYQRRSAALMLQRETNPGQIIDPRLTPQFDQKGRAWFCDVDAGLCFRDPRTFDAVKGGICAETMGLGKTLICLALILATRELSSQIPQECLVASIPVRKTTGSLLDMAAARLGRSGVPWKSNLDQYEAAQGYTFERVREAIKKGAGHYYLHARTPRRISRHAVDIPPRKIWLCAATIVVCPSNLVQQWRSEIKKHTTGLNVLYMSSASARLPSAESLHEYDIILFSKLRFEKEANEDFVDGERSPLRDILFKRLIVDEGHSFGNSSNSSKTLAVTAVESLQLSARWIVSGTPTHGLGAIGRSGQATNTENDLEQDDGDSSPDHDKSSDNTSDTDQQYAFFKQERRDLEKLGNIATHFLQALPWANSPNEDDHASWSQLVMQPRHGSKSRGNMHCLRATLEGMIIRHRPEDVLDDVKLPPLHQNVVYLEGSIQNKLSLNTFSMMIISNAVTSERKDADYFFHPKQRKNLLQLVSNLRQASFFWSGFEAEHVRNTVDNAKDFLEQKKIPVTPEDEALLRQAITMGEAVLENDICQAISKWHEMPTLIQNNFTDDVRSTWSLTGKPTNPTPIGATMVHAIQKFVDSQLWKSDIGDGLFEAGMEAMRAAQAAPEPAPNARVKAQKKKKDLKATKKASETAPVLAGGVNVGDSSSPKKRAVSSVSMTTAKPRTTRTGASAAQHDAKTTESAPEKDGGGSRGSPNGADKTLKSALKKSSKFDESPSVDPSSPLAFTRLVSTASAKLSYLIDKIHLYQEHEKIIVFYEADNVAYYIAQALECLGIKHLIYAKSLSSSRRSQYVVTFNQSEKFRVLLMDVSQAAFGLDMSSASRVYFVNPVFSPQVEAQAVKRAHRIGQTKPVYVETLVLKGSIEEVILKRREVMTNEEHNRCKSILDDQTVYDWIRNVKFQSIPANETSIADQMAKLESPQLLFGRGGSGKASDPDADLVVEEPSPKNKGKAVSLEDTIMRAVEESEAARSFRVTSPVGARPHRQCKVPNANLDEDDDMPMEGVQGTSSAPLPGCKKRKTVVVVTLREGDGEPEPVYEPLDVPQEAESSNSNQHREEDNWDGLAFEDSDEELDI